MISSIFKDYPVLHVLCISYLLISNVLICNVCFALCHLVLPVNMSFALGCDGQPVCPEFLHWLRIYVSWLQEPGKIPQLFGTSFSTCSHCLMAHQKDNNKGWVPKSELFRTFESWYLPLGCSLKLKIAVCNEKLPMRCCISE